MQSDSSHTTTTLRSRAWIGLAKLAAVLIVPALDRRAGRLLQSPAIVVLGDMLVVVGFWMVFIIVWRLLDEERFLARDLPGYVAYREHVRSRLVPYLW